MQSVMCISSYSAGQETVAQLLKELIFIIEAEVLLPC
jgi:hypothetical protein